MHGKGQVLVAQGVAPVAGVDGSRGGGLEVGQAEFQLLNIQLSGDGGGPQGKIDAGGRARRFGRALAVLEAGLCGVQEDRYFAPGSGTADLNRRR